MGRKQGIGEKDKDRASKRDGGDERVRARERERERPERLITVDLHDKRSRQLVTKVLLQH